MMFSSNNIITLLNDVSFSIEPDETILHAALKRGIPFCCECGGNARCSTCRILIIEGEENLTEINSAEEELRKHFELPENVRLACQTQLKNGKVKIKRIMNDESDYPLYLKNKHVKDIGRELQLCLLFLDIRNFTSIVEHHLAFDVIHIIRKLFLSFEEIINQYGGKIIETVGDGLYVAFGFNNNLQQSANDTVNCGNAILKSLKSLNEEYFKKYFREEIEVGIGAHLGKVAIGDLLLRDNKHQIVMGYAVNIASRIQEVTKKLNNNFIISVDIYQFLDKKPLCKYSYQFLKGVKSSIKLYLIGGPFLYKLNK
ncbi:adenylate/guanylate cyclase domain-containing protein [Chondrinema litorale]|uniref:adenylate/guanylate cyclase domain-containing protein n=1 Tax=Chondrinema litorale TaxID=2994555 RepID=UPI0025432D5B|nr:adenylate/guanylate cyclase domain-containing protein [Chondrinema litorale]UZR96849.1 adenylate/guanylate cyclase domain-containing protein [Chondrinema litorale]